MTQPADALVEEALLLQRQNRVPEAIAAYQRILARQPHLATCWFNLAFLQRQVRHLEQALISYQHAIDTGVSRPEEAHLNRSVIFTDYLRQHAAAEAELKLALLLNPAYVPALLNYANLCEDLGRRQEAAALYLQILAIDSNSFEALARYANSQSADHPPATLIAPLRRALARSDASPADQASLGFALGRLLDAAGEYAEAFAVYHDANQSSRASVAPIEPRYDRAWQEAFVDRIIASSGSALQPIASPNRADSRPRAVAMGPRPIFICGMFRSGSTLTEQLLAGLPGVAAGGELDFLPRLIGSELTPFPESVPLLSTQRMDDIVARYGTELARVSKNAVYVIDKRPDNFFYIGLIKRLYPDALIVHTVRNPLDNCLSIYFLHLDQIMSYALDLVDTGHYYREYRRLMTHWKSQFPGDIFDFDYDVLVEDSEPTFARLCEFLGFAWEGPLPHDTISGQAIKTPSVWQVREPLYRKSSGRSRHYAREIEPLREYLSDLLPGPAT